MILNNFYYFQLRLYFFTEKLTDFLFFFFIFMTTIFRINVFLPLQEY